MKKLMALLLAALMVLSMAACAKDTESPKNPTDPSQPSTTDPTEPSGATMLKPEDDNEGMDYANNSVNLGSVTANLGASAGGEVSYDYYKGEAGKDYTDPKVYTFRDYTSGTTDMKWSTHTWETNEDSAILDYITGSFVTFSLGADKASWAVTYEMATKYEDVTKDYVGKYGIAEGETGKAWKFTLRNDLCWEDGTPINADTFIYSGKELLDPVMKNRRADSWYSGDTSIYNAHNYFYQGQTVMTPNSEDGEALLFALADLVKGADGAYTTKDGLAVKFGLKEGYAWMSGNALADYAGAGYVPTDVWEGLSALADENGFVPVTDESMELLYKFTGSDTWGNETKDQLAYYISYPMEYPEMDFSEVGVFKTADNEIVFVTSKPIVDANYYVPYTLGSAYLVYEPLWESCKKFFDADGNEVSKDAANITKITTNYCTTVDTTMSCGPYKLTYFELDKQYTLERNDTWYGYKDGNHLGQYQTDIISVQVIPEQATALLAFEKGDLDNISLQQKDMTKYGSSDYIRYNPQSYTTKLTFNTDVEALSARNTQVLANVHFRRAFSLAIDRTKFVQSYTSGAGAGYSFLNYMYVYDPFTGAIYRETDAAKEALVKLYNMSYGEGGEYGSLDEAYEAMTGYDLETARKIMQKAYDECVADKSYDGSSNIELTISVYASDDIYVQMFNFLNDALKEACVGTGFEGKVSLKMVVDADYYETMESGGTDIIFSTWGGAAYRPYQLLFECYMDAGTTDSPNQMEYGFDGASIQVTLEINGTSYTATMQDWAMWMDGKDVTIATKDGGKLPLFTDFDADGQAVIHGKFEYAYLAQYVVAPLYYRNNALLISKKGDYAVQQYVDLVGFAGIQYYTYNYSDEEWAALDKSTLSY